MTVLIYFGVFVVASLLITLVSQPTIRRRQWAEFNAKVRELDATGRANGWKLVKATFRPGWLFGRGVVVWVRGDELWVSRVNVAGASPW